MLATNFGMLNLRLKPCLASLLKNAGTIEHGLPGTRPTLLEPGARHAVCSGNGVGQQF